MSFIYYFLVGSESQARKFCELAGSQDQYNTKIFRVETMKWNTAMLATLRQTINGDKINIDESEKIPLICGPGSPWLWPVHKDIIHHLHGLNSTGLTELTNLWFKRDRVLPSYCTKKELIGRLTELQQASKLALQEKGAVFLYQA